VQLDLLASDSSLSRFGTLLEQSELRSVLLGPGPFTLFVPTNRALEDAGETLAAFAQPEAAALLHPVCVIDAVLAPLYAPAVGAMQRARQRWAMPCASADC
jgi:hypothetical protein